MRRSETSRNAAFMRQSLQNENCCRPSSGGCGVQFGLAFTRSLELTSFVKISGFTFIRNGNALGYPFVPSIRSLLPLCDEIIVNVPRSTDGTLQSVRAIGDPKIRIIESDWDEKERVGDPILRRHTDRALEECTGDWC